MLDEPQKLLSVILGDIDVYHPCEIAGCHGSIRELFLRSLGRDGNKDDGIPKKK
jgi:hypothetical protein